MRRKSLGRGVIVIGSNGALDNARQGRRSARRSAAARRAERSAGMSGAVRMRIPAALFIHLYTLNCTSKWDSACTTREEPDEPTLLSIYHLSVAYGQVDSPPETPQSPFYKQKYVERYPQWDNAGFCLSRLSRLRPILGTKYLLHS